MRRVLALALAFAWAGPAAAAIHTEAVEYRHGDAVLEGYLAYDDAIVGAPSSADTSSPPRAERGAPGSVAGRRPGVLVVHEWKGLNDYAKRRARQLAELGYVAFAADMYGKGVRAETHEEAAKLSGMYRADRALTRARAQAALDVLKAQPQTDPSRLAAIGYCFGGMAVLELARAGADLNAVVTFHGALDTPVPAAPGAVKAKLLILHGAADGFVTQDKVEAFKQEMDAAGANYRIVQYPGAVHSFTVPEAGNDPAAGMAYNAEADRQSWEEMRSLLAEVFAAD